MKPTQVLVHLLKVAAENGVSLGPTIMPGPKPVPGPSANPAAPPRPAMLPSPSTYMKAPAAPGRQPGAYGPNGQLLMASGPVRPPLAPKAGPAPVPTATAKAPVPAQPAPVKAPAPAPAPTELDKMQSAANPGQALADRWAAGARNREAGMHYRPRDTSTDNLTTAQLLAPPQQPQVARR